MTEKDIKGFGIKLAISASLFAIMIRRITSVIGATPNAALIRFYKHRSHGQMNQAGQAYRLAHETYD